MSAFGRNRVLVTLYPNSTAMGLNALAYSLMPNRLGISFSLWLRATNKKRRNPRTTP